MDNHIAARPGARARIPQMRLMGLLCFLALLMGACEKSRVVIMGEVEYAMNEARGAAKKGDLVAMRARLDEMLVLLDLPNAAVDDEPNYQILLKAVQSISKTIKEAETAKAAFEKFPQLRATCDACHGIFHRKRFK